MVKKIAGLDISTVSPTLGFQIHSLQFKGWACIARITINPASLNCHCNCMDLHLLRVRSVCRVRLNIWDIGGQATLRPYWQNYYERTDALLWVVDSSDVDRLTICR